MKRLQTQFVGTHIFADGSVMTNEAFMSKKYVVDRSKNEEFFQNAETALNVDFTRPQTAKSAYVVKRRAEIKAEIARLEKELSEQ